MSREDPSGRPSGEVIRVLPSGLAVLRYRKHDPIDSAAFSPRELAVRTGKLQGSKFLPRWGLARYLEWVEAEVGRANWTLEPGAIPALTNDRPRPSASSTAPWSTRSASSATGGTFTRIL